MKKIKYFMITGMLLASIGLAGCGKKSEDDITNKEIYQDDLEPLTEEELNEMDADTSDEDMKQIDEPEEETADITDTTDATETTDKTENTDKAETSDSSAKKSADKTETSDSALEAIQLNYFAGASVRPRRYSQETLNTSASATTS